MADSINIAALFQTLFQDQRITAWHISLLSAIMFLHLLNPGLKYVEISRKQLMALAHINSIATYHKYIRQLQDYGYIVYSPAYNYYNRSKIKIADRFDTCREPIV
jgi:hypothetical protein